jgi:NTE family protein
MCLLRNEMRRSVFIVIVTVLLLICPVSTWADEQEAPQRPRIGLVLAGGGAKGFAHIGVIKVLEEMRIPIDFVAGTSMGSLVGGLYASGMSSDRLEEIILGVYWDDLFHDNPVRKDLSFRRKTDDSEYLVRIPVGYRDGRFTSPKGLIEGQKINLLIKSLLLPASQIQDFDKLPIPFRAVAADIENGEAVVLGSGDLAMALRASMSIPGAFSPVEMGGRLLVDGGIALNLPMEVAREMGADVLIVVDLTIPLKKKEELNSGLAVAGQSSAFLTRRNVQRQLATLTGSDVRIHPIMGDISTADFKRGGEAIPIGEMATRVAAGELEKYSVSEEEYGKHLSERKILPSEAPVIEFIRVTTDSRVSPEVVESKLRIRVGEPLDAHELYDNLNIIFGLGYYDTVTYDLVTEDGQTGLVIDARSRSWGPGYFKFGLNLESNLKGSNNYNMGFRYTRTELNSLAGEWRTDLEFGERMRLFTGLHLPMERSLKLFVAPSLQVSKENIDSFDADGDRIAEHRVTDAYATLTAGSEIGNWGEFRLGVRRGVGDVDLLVGTVPPVVDNFDRGDAFLKLSLDTLDNIHFPHHGSLGTANVVLSREGLGADDAYERFSMDWFGASTWDKSTIVTGLAFGTTRDEDAPLYDQFTLGGFLNLSGYGSNELRGQNYGLIKLAYYHRVRGSLTSVLEGVPVYTGISIEAGNVWDDLNDADIDSMLAAGSVFVGADTPVGPLYLAAGYGEGGRASLYFYLGRTF